MASVEALRKDALLQVERLADEHARRLQSWADSWLEAALAPAPSQGPAERPARSASRSACEVRWLARPDHSPTSEAGQLAQGPCSSANIRITTFPGCPVQDFEETNERAFSKASRRSRPSKGIVTMSSTNDVQQWVQEQEEKHGEEKVTEDDSCAKRAVHSGIFDKTIGALLILNAVVVGFKADWLARGRTTEAPLTFVLLDWLFVSAFLVELVMRFVAGPKDFYQGKEWKWNAFDAMVVGVQIADETAQLILKGPHLAYAMTSFSFVRVVRLARLTRFVRMVRLLSGLKSLVYLLLASMSSFGWAALMLLFLMFCVAVYFTEVSSVGVQDAAPEVAIILTKYWGSLPRSMLTLLKAIFGGFDWQDALDVFEDVGSDMYVLNALVMSSYVSFATLVMLNLVTGVFVEGAQRIAGEDRRRELVRLASHIFDLADGKGNGELEEEEFMQILGSDMMASFCGANKIETGEVHMLYQLLRETDSKSVPIGDFVTACKLMQGEARSADMLSMRLMCKQYFVESEERMERIEELVGRAASPAPQRRAPSEHGASPGMSRASVLDVRRSTRSPSVSSHRDNTRAPSRPGLFVEAAPDDARSWTPAVPSQERVKGHAGA